VRDVGGLPGFLRGSDVGSQVLAAMQDVLPVHWWERRKKDRAKRIRMFAAHTRTEGAPLEANGYELNGHSDEVAELFGVSWRTNANRVEEP